MILKHKIYIAILFCILYVSLKAQVSVVSINIQPFNITPEALLNVGVMNGGEEQQVQLITQIFSSTGNVIMTVKSQSFKLVKGLNAGMSGDKKIASTEYSGNTQSNYIRSTHNLPSGRYKVCSSLLIASGTDKLDDFCDEIEAEFNQYLYLVNPIEGDTVESKNPILSWTHSEPFTILSQGEFYRMVVAEVKKGQSAEEALTINSPAMVKNYVKEHQVQYPYDAKELKDGSRYAWQVQKIGDGIVINKSEAWTFVVRSILSATSLKYVALKPEIDGSFYTAYNGKVFFKFSEEYKTQGNMKCELLDSKSNIIKIEVEKDVVGDKKKPEELKQMLLKNSGDNRYELNLDDQKLKSGFYTLVVKNEKNESFYLKIFLP